MACSLGAMPARCSCRRWYEADALVMRTVSRLTPAALASCPMVKDRMIFSLAPVVATGRCDRQAIKERRAMAINETAHRTMPNGVSPSVAVAAPKWFAAFLVAGLARSLLLHAASSRSGLLRSGQAQAFSAGLRRPPHGAFRYSRSAAWG